MAKRNTKVIAVEPRTHQYKVTPTGKRTNVTWDPRQVKLRITTETGRTLYRLQVMEENNLKTEDSLNDITVFQSDLRTQWFIPPQGDTI